MLGDGASAPAAPAVGTCRPGERLPGPPGAQIVLLRADAAYVAGALCDLLASRGTARAVRDDTGRVALLRATHEQLGGVVPAELEGPAAASSSPPRPGWLGSRRILAIDYAAREVPPAVARARRAQLERELIATLDNPRDGFLDRILNRRLSRPLSRVLLGLPITPNQISVAGLLLSLGAAALIALPGILWPVLGALLLQLTAVLDCVDGEIARAKVLESEWGEWLDITSDTLIHVATFFGIAVHAWPDLGRETAWALGALFAVGGLASFAVVTRAEKTEEQWKRIDAWQSRVLATLLATLTTRDTSLIVLVAAATDLLTELLIGAAAGAQVFWVTCLALHTSLMARCRAVDAPRAAPAD